ncbi:hypothetical protein AL522_09405 [Pantoea vagans]|nr:hypothetical protein AL522_09405 [Pantoea vagans]
MNPVRREHGQKRKAPLAGPSVSRMTAFASFQSDRVFCAGSIRQQSRPDAVIKIKPVIITGFFMAMRHPAISAQRRRLI